MRMGRLRFPQELAALLQACLLKSSVNRGAACAALNYTPAQLGSAPARAVVGKPGEPLSDCKVNARWSGDALDVRRERSGGGEPQSLPFSVFSISGRGSSLFFPWFLEACWRAAALCTGCTTYWHRGSSGAYPLASTSTPMSWCQKCLGLTSVTHFQVNMPDPEPKSSPGSVTVRMAYWLQKTSNLTILYKKCLRHSKLRLSDLTAKLSQYLTV